MERSRCIPFLLLAVFMHAGIGRPASVPIFSIFGKQSKQSNPQSSESSVQWQTALRRRARDLLAKHPMAHLYSSRLAIAASWAKYTDFLPWTLGCYATHVYF